MDKLFAKFSTATAKVTGSPLAFLTCVLLVIVWAITGPAFKFSETWQLVINTGTTIITFLMVFILNNAQSRDTTAINLKLDSLILAVERADNRLVGLETLPASEADAITADVGATPPGTNEASS